MKKIYITMCSYITLGLISGLFYREYTKIKLFDGVTTLAKVHTHILALGFLVFALYLLFEAQFKVSIQKFFKSFYITYNAGLLLTIGTLVIRGLLEINSTDLKGLNHIAGMGHFILGLGFIFMCMNIWHSIKPYIHN